jgi:hypothetical protein
LPLDEAIGNLEDVRSFLEIEAAFHLIPALGVQYADSDESDSREDHITHILNRVRFEVLFVNELSLEMRERYLQQQYPDIYQDFHQDFHTPSTAIHEIVPQDIEVIREDRKTTIEIIVLSTDEPPPPPVECPICLEDTVFNEINKTYCKHEFCHSCLLRHMTTNMTCPLCREYINHVRVTSNEQSQAITQSCMAYYEKFDESDYDDLPELIPVDNTLRRLDFSSLMPIYDDPEN